MKTSLRFLLPIALTALACGEGVLHEPRRGDAAVARGPDAGGRATFVITGLALTPNAVDQGGKAILEVDLVATGTLPLTDGELRITVQPPTGDARAVKVVGISLVEGETLPVTQEITGLDQPGMWTLFASLHAGSGPDERLADGPSEGVGLTVNAVGTCDPECAGATPICDAVTNTCVCTDDSCGAGLACDADSHQCTCATACAGATPDCDLAAKACVCDASSCPAGQACGAAGACAAATCSPACSGATPSCNANTRACECTASSCGAGKSCTKGACATAADTRTIAEIVDGATRVRKFAETNKRLPSYVTMGSTQVTMASFLMLEVSSVLEIRNAQTTAVPLKSFTAPAAPKDDTVQGQVPQAEYLKIAGDVQSYMSSSGKAPDYAYKISLGTYFGFTNLVYSYAKILDFYGTNKRLPGYVTLDLFSTASTTTSNPQSPIVGYEQINLTSSWGSCGSHSGGVGIAHLRGFTTVSQATQVESDIYWSYGGRVYGGPGRSTLAGAFNSYLNAKGVPYTAYLFSDSSAVLERINAGTPVVANTDQWGGHFVCIYGLVDEGGTWKVYFSDGAINDGLGAGLPTGNLKKWNWSTFKAHVTSGYVGFKHK